jgi:hypothetical protein
VAPLIDAARAARAEAERLRRESAELRLALRWNKQIAGARTRQAATVAAGVRRQVPMASPWSGLLWLREDDSLDQILVPLD